MCGVLPRDRLILDPVPCSQRNTARQGETETVREKGFERLRGVDQRCCALFPKGAVEKADPARRKVS